MIFLYDKLSDNDDNILYEQITIFSVNYAAWTLFMYCEIIFFFFLGKKYEQISRVLLLTASAEWWLLVNIVKSRTS